MSAVELLKDGITIFMTTAYLDEAERCNRVGLMHRGRLIRCETPEAMKQATGAGSLEGASIQTITELAGRAGPGGPAQTWGSAPQGGQG
jgi:ABC-2 type transport system ATP-binding protein